MFQFMATKNIKEGKGGIYDGALVIIFCVAIFHSIEDWSWKVIVVLKKCVSFEYQCGLQLACSALQSLKNAFPVL
jgi:hypothetical protein